LAKGCAFVAQRLRVGAGRPPRRLGGFRARAGGDGLGTGGAEGLGANRVTSLFGKGNALRQLFLLSLLVLLAPLAAPAEEPAASAPAPVVASASTAPKWYEAVEVHGYVDAYYGVRFAGGQDSPNSLRAFDTNNGFVLNLAKATILMNPTASLPVGFRIDFGFGNTMNAIGDLDTLNPDASRYLEQAYGTLKLGDFTVDLGKFVTSAGAEVVEAKDDWNYSRSLLFWWAIPTTHTGLRVGYGVPGVDGLTLQAGVVNGWDVAITDSAYKTLNLGVVYNGPSNTILSLVYYGGPNPTLVVPGGTAIGNWQNLLDLVLQRSFGDFTFNANGDYGILSGIGKWYGFSLMGRYSAFEDKLRISARYEYFWDPEGLRVTFVPQGGQYTEGTVTLGVPVTSNAEVRLEYRIDHANAPIFYGGNANDNTMEAALLVWF